MRISHSKKFIYISIPKTASTSIRKVLNDFSDISSRSHKGPFSHHGKANELKKHFDKEGWKWDEYFKFTVVRNPWDRTVSLWKYFTSQKNHSKYKELPLKDYIRGYDKKTKSHFSRHSNYASWYESDSGEILLDCFIKLENLDSQFHEVSRKIGIPPVEVPHVNRSSRADYKEYYDNESKQRIEEEFSKEIAFFNYSFDDEK